LIILTEDSVKIKNEWSSGIMEWWSNGRSGVVGRIELMNKCLSEKRRE
jgi:hypothetical protein